MPSVTMFCLFNQSSSFSFYSFLMIWEGSELCWDGRPWGIKQTPDTAFLALVFQMEPLWAGGSEEPMKHRRTGEVLCLSLRNAPVDWRGTAWILSITATAMPTGTNGDFHTIFFCKTKFIFLKWIIQHTES